MQRAQPLEKIIQEYGNVIYRFGEIQSQSHTHIRVLMLYRPQVYIFWHEEIDLSMRERESNEAHKTLESSITCE